MSAPRFSEHTRVDQATRCERVLREATTQFTITTEVTMQSWMRAKAARADQQRMEACKEAVLKAAATAPSNHATIECDNHLVAQWLQGNKVKRQPCTGRVSPSSYGVTGKGGRRAWRRTYGNGKRTIGVNLMSPHDATADWALVRKS